jgi:glycine oxidase
MIGDMAARLRVAIVGDGIIGWSTAFELARRGVDVTVYRGGWSGAATRASAGILAPYTEAHHASPLLDLAVRGLAAYDDFVARLRAASPVPFEYRMSGTLEVAEDAERAESLQQRLGASTHESAGCRWLEADRLRAENPFIRDGCRGALLCAAHRYVNVGSFVAALEDAASRAGAVSVHGPARAVDVRTKRVTVTTEEESDYDTVVLAAGAWTPLIDPLGRTCGRIRPVRGQLVRLKSPRLRSAPIIWGRSCYIVPWQDGTVLVGATVEEADFEVRATVTGVRSLLTAAEELIPALASATFVDVRVGLRPASDEETPILGPGENSRIVYAAGHFRNGVLLAPLTARILTDFILEGTEDSAFTASPAKKGV